MKKNSKKKLGSILKNIKMDDFNGYMSINFFVMGNLFLVLVDLCIMEEEFDEVDEDDEL